MNGLVIALSIAVFLSGFVGSAIGQGYYGAYQPGQAQSYDPQSAYGQYGQAQPSYGQYGAMQQYYGHIMAKALPLLSNIPTADSNTSSRIPELRRVRRLQRGALRPAAILFLRKYDAQSRSSEKSAFARSSQSGCQPVSRRSAVADLQHSERSIVCSHFGAG